MSCATTRKIPVSSIDPRELIDEKMIIVTLKNDQKYEVTDFTITDTHIVGTFVQIDKNGEKKKAENIKMIQFEDIAFIQLNPNKFTPPSKSCIRFIACMGLVLLLAIFFYFQDWGDMDFGIKR